MTMYVEDKAPTPSEITLEVEELEEVIAPKLASNHNETLLDVSTSHKSCNAS